MKSHVRTELIKKIESMHEAELKFVLKSLIQSKTSSQFESQILKIFELKSEHSSFCKVADDKFINLSRMRDVADSFMFEILESMVKTILKSKKPLQTGNIISLAIKEDSGSKVVEEKFGKADKVIAGYLLQMAGFEFISVYDNDRKMPVKVWKPKYGTAKLAFQARVDIARQQIFSELDRVNTQNLQPFLNEMSPECLDNLI